MCRGGTVLLTRVSSHMAGSCYPLHFWNGTFLLQQYQAAGNAEVIKHTSHSFTQSDQTIFQVKTVRISTEVCHMQSHVAYIGAD